MSEQLSRHGDVPPLEGATVFLRYVEDGQQLWAYPAVYAKGTWYATFNDDTKLVRKAQPDDLYVANEEEKIL